MVFCLVFPKQNTIYKGKQRIRLQSARWFATLKDVSLFFCPWSRSHPLHEQKPKFKHTLSSIITNVKFAASLKNHMDKLNFFKIKAIKSQGDFNFSTLTNIFYHTDNIDLLASFVTEESSCVHVMLTPEMCAFAKIWTEGLRN